MFTKIDLVAGFAEFFGDLKKSERAQAWGATIRLDADKREPGKLFDAEFDVLVEKLHTRGLRRMALERNREMKEKVYQFPLEFAAIKRNLSDFLAAAFAPSGTGRASRSCAASTSRAACRRAGPSTASSARWAARSACAAARRTRRRPRRSSRRASSSATSS